MARHTTTTRRRVLAGAGGLVLGTTGLVGSAAAQSGSGTDLAGWLATTDDADSVVDETGASEVRITVGSEANGGAFGFAPPVVRVDPDTTVVWEWTGEGGSHNVVAEDGSFESELVAETGHTFEWTAEAGVYPYACAPHRSIGMRGAVVVGDAAVSLGGEGGTAGPDETATPTRTTTETPAPAGEPERRFGGWLSDTDNYHRVVDARGQSQVAVAVGARGNGGPFAFDPPVVHVDPGTTVVWRWVSDGTTHDVVDRDGLYESADASERGTTYAVRFDGHGVSEYACVPHQDVGMRGVVVVGHGQSERVTPLGFGLTAGLGGATVLALLKMMADSAPDLGATPE